MFLDKDIDYHLNTFFKWCLISKARDEIVTFIFAWVIIVEEISTFLVYKVGPKER